jgi:hypothetical protein
MWQHNYEPIAGSLGVSAIVAALPIVVLFVMLGVLRKPAWMSATTALASALLVSLVVYRMPFNLAIISTIYGAAFGIFPIAWIVFASIMLYRLAVDTGKFEIIKDTIAGLTSDRRLQAMFIAFSFGAFIEGAAGFGAPVAISGAMLAGLGFNPFYAAGICLLANTAPVAFGSIGIPVTTLANLTGLPVLSLSATVGMLCAMVSVIIPGYLIVVMAGWKRAFEVLPAIVACGLSFAGMQFYVSRTRGPELTDIMSSLTCIVVMVFVLKLWSPKTIMRLEGDTAVATTVKRYGAGDVVMAWVPYLMLVLFVLVWGDTSIKHQINQWADGFVPSSWTTVPGHREPSDGRPSGSTGTAQSDRARAASCREARALRSLVRAELAERIWHSVSPRHARHGAGVARASPDGRQGVRRHIQTAQACDANHCLHAWTGVRHELFRHDINARPRARRDRRRISILQRGAWMAWRVSHRERHISQCPLRQPSGRNCERLEPQSRAHRVGKLCGGGDG